MSNKKGGARTVGRIVLQNARDKSITFSVVLRMEGWFYHGRWPAYRLLPALFSGELGDGDEPVVGQHRGAGLRGL